MNIYGVYYDDDGRDYKAFFTSKDDAIKHAALLEGEHGIEELTVDDPENIRRARLGLSMWCCTARSESAGPDFAVEVMVSLAKTPMLNNSQRHTQWQRNPQMRPWDSGYNNRNYYMPDCDVLMFFLLATSHDDATAKAAQIRARWLAGEPIEQLRELVKTL